MLDIKIDLNDVKHNFEAGGIKFADNAFETAVKDMITTCTDENGNFNGIFGVLGRDYEKDGVTISMTNVSHKITNIDTKTMMADVRILDTPNGKILQQLFTDNQVHPTINAMGNTSDNGDGTKVANISQLFSIDFDINRK